MKPSSDNDLKTSRRERNRWDFLERFINLLGPKFLKVFLILLIVLVLFSVIFSQITDSNLVLFGRVVIGTETKELEQTLKKLEEVKRQQEVANYQKTYSQQTKLSIGDITFYITLRNINPTFDLNALQMNVQVYRHEDNEDVLIPYVEKKIEMNKLKILLPVEEVKAYQVYFLIEPKKDRQSLGKWKTVYVNVGSEYVNATPVN